MNEQAICFGQFGSLVGILTSPPAPGTELGNTAVLFLNAGIVHRVSAGRVYVRLARALASMGLLTFRFDFSGIGDSAARPDNLSFDKSAVVETQDAMDFLSSGTGARQFILLGGCSGARVAFDTACCDNRVIGALLINFPSTDEADAPEDRDLVEGSKLFYYRRFALSNPSSWWRLLTGKTNYSQLSKSLWCATKRLFAPKEDSSPRAKQFRSSLHHLAERGVLLSFICSEGDHRLDGLRAAGGRDFRTLCAERRVALDIISDSDHTFSSLQDQDRLIKAVALRAMKMSPVHREIERSPSVGVRATCWPQYQP